eukprot:GHVU01145615.1.p1 GENE.GHVU01145615.1~~GHVU01145615.1.p1  ORF type:complete len:3547 (+),score=395.68 GHVU01145615.1:1301-10642(+)
MTDDARNDHYVPGGSADEGLMDLGSQYGMSEDSEDTSAHFCSRSPSQDSAKEILIGSEDMKCEVLLEEGRHNVITTDRVQQLREQGANMIRSDGEPFSVLHSRFDHGLISNRSVEMEVSTEGRRSRLMSFVEVPATFSPDILLTRTAWEELRTATAREPGERRNGMTEEQQRAFDLAQRHEVRLRIGELELRRIGVWADELADNVITTGMMAGLQDAGVEINIIPYSGRSDTHLTELRLRYRRQSIDRDEYRLFVISDDNDEGLWLTGRSEGYQQIRGLPEPGRTPQRWGLLRLGTIPVRAIALESDGTFEHIITRGLLNALRLQGNDVPEDNETTIRPNGIPSRGRHATVMVHFGNNGWSRVGSHRIRAKVSETPVKALVIRREPEYQGPPLRMVRETEPVSDSEGSVTDQLAHADEDGDNLGNTEHMIPGVLNYQEIKEMLLARLDTEMDAKDFDQADKEEVTQILQEFVDVFRIYLAPGDPPADVPPMKAPMKPEARPTKTKLRKYGPGISIIIATFFASMLDMNWYYRNDNAYWASAPLVVAKCANPVLPTEPLVNPEPERHSRAPRRGVAPRRQDRGHLRILDGAMEGLPPIRFEFVSDRVTDARTTSPRTGSHRRGAKVEADGEDDESSGFEGETSKTAIARLGDGENSKGKRISGKSSRPSEANGSACKQSAEPGIFRLRTHSRRKKARIVMSDDEHERRSWALFVLATLCFVASMFVQGGFMALVPPKAARVFGKFCMGGIYRDVTISDLAEQLDQVMQDEDLLEQEIPTEVTEILENAILKDAMGFQERIATRAKVGSLSLGINPTEFAKSLREKAAALARAEEKRQEEEQRTQEAEARRAPKVSAATDEAEASPEGAQSLELKRLTQEIDELKSMMKDLLRERAVSKEGAAAKPQQEDPDGSNDGDGLSKAGACTRAKYSEADTATKSIFSGARTGQEGSGLFGHVTATATVSPGVRPPSTIRHAMAAAKGKVSLGMAPSGAEVIPLEDRWYPKPGESSSSRGYDALCPKCRQRRAACRCCPEEHDGNKEVHERGVNYHDYDEPQAKEARRRRAQINFDQLDQSPREDDSGTAVDEEPWKPDSANSLVGGNTYGQLVDVTTDGNGASRGVPSVPSAPPTRPTFTDGRPDDPRWDRYRYGWVKPFRDSVIWLPRHQRPTSSERVEHEVDFDIQYMGDEGNRGIFGWISWPRRGRDRLWDNAWPDYAYYTPTGVLLERQAYVLHYTLESSTTTPPSAGRQPNWQEIPRGTDQFQEWAKARQMPILYRFDLYQQAVMLSDEQFRLLFGRPRVSMDIYLSFETDFMALINAAVDVFSQEFAAWVRHPMSLPEGSRLTSENAPRWFVWFRWLEGSNFFDTYSMVRDVRGFFKDAKFLFGNRFATQLLLSKELDVETLPEMRDRVQTTPLQSNIRRPWVRHWLRIMGAPPAGDHLIREMVAENYINVIVGARLMNSMKARSLMVAEFGTTEEQALWEEETNALDRSTSVTDYVYELWRQRVSREYHIGAIEGRQLPTSHRNLDTDGEGGFPQLPRSGRVPRGTLTGRYAFEMHRNECNFGLAHKWLKDYAGAETRRVLLRLHINETSVRQEEASDTDEDPIVKRWRAGPRRLAEQPEGWNRPLSRRGHEGIAWMPGTLPNQPVNRTAAVRPNPSGLHFVGGEPGEYQEPTPSQSTAPVGTAAADQKSPMPEEKVDLEKVDVEASKVWASQQRSANQSPGGGLLQQPIVPPSSGDRDSTKRTGEVSESSAASASQPTELGDSSPPVVQASTPSEATTQSEPPAMPTVTSSQPPGEQAQQQEPPTTDAKPLSLYHTLVLKFTAGEKATSDTGPAHPSDTTAISAPDVNNQTSRVHTEEYEQQDEGAHVPKYPEGIPVSQLKLDMERYEACKDRLQTPLARRLASAIVPRREDAEPEAPREYDVHDWRHQATTDIIEDGKALEDLAAKDDHEWDYLEGGLSNEENACADVADVSTTSSISSFSILGCGVCRRKTRRVTPGWKRSEEAIIALRSVREGQRRRRMNRMKRLRQAANRINIKLTLPAEDFPSEFSADALPRFPRVASLNPKEGVSAIPVRLLRARWEQADDSTTPRVAAASLYEGCRAWAKLRQYFRITIDLRRVNENLYQLEYPFPDIDEVGEYLVGAKYFGVFDLVDGYTQCLLHENSRELFSVITKEGVYTPFRVPQGASCSVGYFQASMERVYRPILRNGVLVYLDDLLVYGRTKQEYFERLRTVFRLSREHNIKISAKKGTLIGTEVVWCGRSISEAGVKHTNDRVESLAALPLPTTGAQLWQFVGAATWMRAHVPNFNVIIQPLQDCLERVKKKAGKGFVKKKGCAKIELNEGVGWDIHCVKAFADLKEALKKQVQLAHPDKNHWGGVVTQVSTEAWKALLASNANLPPDDGTSKSCAPGPSLAEIASLDHQPLAFLSGTFRGAQLKWSTIEKEAFAIRTSLLRYEHLFLRSKGVIVLTDHRNLEFLFGKESTRSLPSYVRDKLFRWYVSIVSIPYRIRFLSGEHNHWADMFSRWGNVDAKDMGTIDKCTLHMGGAYIRALTHSLPWPEPKDIAVPELSDVAKAQMKYDKSRPKGAMEDQEGLWRVVPPKLTDEDNVDVENAPIWIPTEEEDLILRILVTAHCHDGIHSSQAVTNYLVSKRFWWKGMTTDVRQFCRECLHCLRGRSGEMVPRPLGETLKAERVGEVLHMDFVQMDAGVEGENYILCLKDDLTSFGRLLVSQSATAAFVHDQLCEWIRAYGPPAWIVSDTGSHFKNDVVEKTTATFGGRHHFTTAYCPWANGTVENFVGLVVRVCRTLRSTQPDKRNGDWKDFVPLIEARLNDTPMNNSTFTPRMVFLNHHLGEAAAKSAFDKEAECRTEDDRSIIEALSSDEHWEELRQQWTTLHERRLDERTAVLDKSRTQAAKTTAKEANFEIGTFVLLARGAHRTGEKLSLRWTGPFRVTGIVKPVRPLGRPKIYEIEDLSLTPNDGRRRVRRAHCRRLRFYCSKLRGRLEDIIMMAKAQVDEFPIESLLECRYNKQTKRHEVHVKWDGFDDDENTWEPVRIIAVDAPKLMYDFLLTSHAKMTDAAYMEAYNALPKLWRDKLPRERPEERRTRRRG